MTSYVGSMKLTLFFLVVVVFRYLPYMCVSVWAYDNENIILIE